ncbi:uncharacterized protein ARMOST_03764 [Armillaria ostoyae]|uniref:Uncharacterized protein n=1 Tax=Armillaria ostoyae TaxID=47428 RepID=A0A284QVL0_ARMOS|nr:uncharacterized protein ARMOST_03764 [Armillaria ostoyae]
MAFRYDPGEDLPSWRVLSSMMMISTKWKKSLPVEKTKIVEPRVISHTTGLTLDSLRYGVEKNNNAHRCRRIHVRCRVQDVDTDLYDDLINASDSYHWIYRATVDDLPMEYVPTPGLPRRFLRRHISLSLASGILQATSGLPWDSVPPPRMAMTKSCEEVSLDLFAQDTVYYHATLMQQVYNGKRWIPGCSPYLILVQRGYTVQPWNLSSDDTIRDSPFVRGVKMNLHSRPSRGGWKEDLSIDAAGRMGAYIDRLSTSSSISQFKGAGAPALDQSHKMLAAVMPFALVDEYQ